MEEEKIKWLIDALDEERAHRERLEARLARLEAPEAAAAAAPAAEVIVRLQKLESQCAQLTRKVEGLTGDAMATLLSRVGKVEDSVIKERHAREEAIDAARAAFQSQVAQVNADRQALAGTVQTYNTNFTSMQAEAADTRLRLQALSQQVAKMHQDSIAQVGQIFESVSAATSTQLLPIVKRIESHDQEITNVVEKLEAMAPPQVDTGRRQSVGPGAPSAYPQSVYVTSSQSGTNTGSNATTTAPATTTTSYMSTSLPSSAFGTGSNVPIVQPASNGQQYMATAESGHVFLSARDDRTPNSGSYAPAGGKTYTGVTVPLPQGAEVPAVMKAVYTTTKASSQASAAEAYSDGLPRQASIGKIWERPQAPAQAQTHAQARVPPQAQSQLDSSRKVTVQRNYIRVQQSG